MALDFSGAGSDRVDCGSDASLDDFSAHSVVAWIYIPTLGFGLVAAKDTAAGGFEKEWTIRATGQINAFMQMTTTSMAARSDNSAGNIITANNWWFVGYTASSGFVPKLYLGNLTTTVSEVTYITQTTGVGTPVSDAAASFVIGNNIDVAGKLPGIVACLTYVDRELSVGELRILQYRFTKLYSGQQGIWQLGFDGTGTQADLSGNGNNGTVTGATVADHAPIPPPFGFDLGWQGAFTTPAVGQIFPGINHPRRNLLLRR